MPNKYVIGLLRLTFENVEPRPAGRPSVVQRIGAGTESLSHAMEIQGNRLKMTKISMHTSEFVLHAF